jgi:RNA polymerase sigma-70 factor (ECF subfamily)
MEQVIEAIKSGETERFAELISCFQQQLFRYCFYMLGSRQDAEDAVQEVFIKAYEHLHQYKRTVSVSAWLYKIAGNHCLNLINKRKRFHTLLPIIGASVETHATTAYGEGELDTAWSEAIAGLKPEERNLLVLRVFEDKSFEEIAAILNVKSSLVRKKFARLKQKVQKFLMKEKTLHEPLSLI